MQKSRRINIFVIHLSHVMIIAEQKKKSNISEYIIYMYQTEDLIRSYKFNIDEIATYVVKHIPAQESDKQNLVKWYAEIAKQMQEEGIEKSGHLSFVNEIMEALSAMNLELIKSDRDYRKIYDQAKIHIKKNRDLSEGKITDDIQICMNGIYGFLLLRMNGKKLDESLQSSINAFGDLLSYLSYKYQKRNATQ
ncbi:DUF4924 family protein [Fulvivirgaceae bacterium BMA10]|uniref:DUF4924 family protein n=1 Tax=Splendidivirga corallicola TaxID=3051826 RepID=A0ABT8KJP8_9BACT|nr:DUF4924 family protein [Fulvivirgaceae bacterium BMA10]